MGTQLHSNFDTRPERIAKKLFAENQNFHRKELGIRYDELVKHKKLPIMLAWGAAFAVLTAVLFVLAGPIAGMTPLLYAGAGAAITASGLMVGYVHASGTGDRELSTIRLDYMRYKDQMKLQELKKEYPNIKFKNDNKNAMSFVNKVLNYSEKKTTEKTTEITR